jgi:beta-lactamase class A
LRWDQVVKLGLRSVPSGLTQDWPVDAPITVETLATLMISRSDNTATDTLMRLVGRDRIDARLRASGHSGLERMWPMLTTLEAFALKAKGPEMAARWAKATVAERLTILVSLQRELDPSKVAAALPSSDRPMEIESIEWFASPEDIARILDLLRQRTDLRVGAILAVNPALPPDQQARFARIGYKGGSEPGVISMSYVLQGKDGTWYVATGSWNDSDKPVDDGKFQQLMLRLVAQLP